MQSKTTEVSTYKVCKYKFQGLSDDVALFSTTFQALKMKFQKFQ